jgi:CheY-like chemotaxis protein
VIAMTLPAQWRILVIDDNGHVLRAVSRLIAAEGHLGFTATNGRVALEMLGQAEYELILCDIMMPELDGVAFYEEVEHRWPHLVSRIVFMSGDVEQQRYRRRAFFARTRVSVIPKPFGLHELSWAMHRRCVVENLP